MQLWEQRINYLKDKYISLKISLQRKLSLLQPNQLVSSHLNHLPDQVVKVMKRVTTINNLLSWSKREDLSKTNLKTSIHWRVTVVVLEELTLKQIKYRIIWRIIIIKAKIRMVITLTSVLSLKEKLMIMVITLEDSVYSLLH